MSDAGPTARLRYTEPMLRRAVRVFVWRSLRRMGAVWMLAIMLVLAGMVVAAWLGDGFIAGFGAAALLFAAVFIGAMWRAHFVQTVGRFRKLDPPEATLILGASSFTVRSSQGASTIPWPRIVEGWALPDCWMLFLATNQFLTIPTADLPPDMLAMLRARLPTLR